MIIRFTNLKEEDRTFEQKVLLRIISIEPVKNVQYKYKQSTTSSVNLDKSELAVLPDKHLRIIKKIDLSIIIFNLEEISCRNWSNVFLPAVSVAFNYEPVFFF